MSSPGLMTLGQICARKPQYGYTATASDSVVGPKFLRTTDIVGGFDGWLSVPRCEISETDYLKYRLAPGDIVISRMGTVGISAVIQEPVEAVFASYLVRFRVDADLADARYVYYLLNSPAWWEYVNSVKTGAVQPNLNARLMSAFTFRLPPLATQREIARSLAVVDDLVDTNRRLVKSLEEASEAVFLHVRRTFADLASRAIVDLCSIFGGSTPRTGERSFWDDGRVAWATPKDLSRLPSLPLLETERRITDAGLAQISSGLLPAGTLLMSSRAPVGYLAIAEVALAVNQGFIAMVCDQGVSNLYLWQWLKANMDQVVARANGSTFLEISKANFRPILVDVPTPLALAEFDRLVSPLYRSMVELEREIVSLQKARDELLPLLMSGRVIPAEAAS